MNPYPSYKDSGVEWIGEIPSEWGCFRLGVIGEFSSSGIDKKSKEGEVDVRMVNYTDLIKSRKYNPILNGDKDFMKVTTPQSKLNEHNLRKGDMVFIPSSETYEDLGYSSLIDFDEDDIVYSYHILRFRNHKPIYHFYKKYLINHHSVLNQFSSEGKGTTRQIIGRNVFRNVRVVLPPKETQTQIVSFLDTKTQKIDDLIHKTEKKIELLKEKRTSLINHCVTKGLNPNVEMKDSGVEWIGEIPNHWVLVKPWRLFKPEKRKPEYGDEIITCFRDGQVTLRKNRREGGFTNSLKEIGYQRILIGDLVVHEMDGFEGSIGVSDSIGKSTPVYTVISSSSKHNNRFWMYLLREMSNTRYIESLSKSIRERTTEFRWNTWKTQKFPNPQLTEQTQIVEYLDEQTQKIDSTIEKETQRIELLKEYRQSLISEVVTGKIDVRDWKE